MKSTRPMFKKIRPSQNTLNNKSNSIEPELKQNSTRLLLFRIIRLGKEICLAAARASLKKNENYGIFFVQINCEIIL